MASGWGVGFNQVPAARAWEKLLGNRDVWLLNPGNMLAGLGSPIARDPLRLQCIFAKCVSLL